MSLHEEAAATLERARLWAEEKERRRVVHEEAAATLERARLWAEQAEKEEGGRRSCPRLPPLDPRVPLTLLAPGSLDVLLRDPHIWRF